MAVQLTDRSVAGFGADARLLDFAAHADDRGRLIELDFSQVPFEVRRVFTVASVPAGTVRGGHAHRETEQVLSCVAGRVEVEIRRDARSAEVTLTPGGGGLYLAPGVWSAQRYAGAGSALVVLASGPFDPDDYDASH